MDAHRSADVDAIRRYQSGDHLAFNDLVNRYYAKVAGVLFHILHNPHDAEEVAQDTFLQVTKTIDRYDPEKASFLSWLLMQARCRALDHLRKARRRHETPLDDNQAAEIPSTYRESWQEVIELSEALDRLPSNQRSVIRDQYFDGYSNGEIARRQGIPIGTVSSRRYRALKLLKGLLDQSET